MRPTNPEDTRRRSRQSRPRLLAAAAIWCLLVGVGAPARALEVSLELILAVDCSSSVEPEEFALQMQGIADAFRHPTVLQAIRGAAPNGIAVTLVQWSGAGMHNQATDWILVSNKDDAENVAQEFENTPRFMRWGATAIGEAIIFSQVLFEDNGFEGLRKVIDISGDGISNQGTFPTFAREAAAREGITINGLAILNDEPSLDHYYRQQVMAGPRSFVERAARFEDFATAMRRKLIREIGSPPAVQLPKIDPAHQVANSSSTTPKAPKSATTELPAGAL